MRLPQNFNNSLPNRQPIVKQPQLNVDQHQTKDRGTLLSNVTLEQSPIVIKKQDILRDNFMAAREQPSASPASPFRMVNDPASLAKQRQGLNTSSCAQRPKLRTNQSNMNKSQQNIGKHI